ncbi:MAG: helix-turn-helix transcriptional regulator [Acidimicrobiaceae bacterium]|nr:helix-turn-helix transcriptional regulator [Acidimicrobiaceae bacterium]
MFGSTFMKELAEPIGTWVRQQRLAAGLTQEELAERSGVSVRTISDLERRRTQHPYPRSIRALATSMGMSSTQSDELIAAWRKSQLDERNKPAPTAVAPSAVPRRLPAPVRHFTGRAAALRSLSDQALELFESAGDLLDYARALLGIGFRHLGRRLDLVVVDGVICGDLYAGGCDLEVVPPSWYHEDHYVEHHPGELRNPALSIRAEVAPETLRILAESSADLVRQAVVEAKQVPEDLVDRLCDDPGLYVCEAALGRTHDEARLRRGATLDKPRLRQAVAKNAATPTDVLEQLAADPEPGPREGVTLNERTPAAWIDRLAGGDPSAHVRWSALKRARSPRVIADAVRSPDKAVRAGAASNPRLSEADMRTLADDPEAFVRYTLAHYGRLPPDLMVRLRHDPDQTVRSMLAGNERLPSELLVELLHDDRNVVRQSAAVAGRRRGLNGRESDLR